MSATCARVAVCEAHVGEPELVHDSAAHLQHGDRAVAANEVPRFPTDLEQVATAEPRLGIRVDSPDAYTGDGVHGIGA